MGTLVIEDVDERLLDDLTCLAVLNQLSVGQQARALLRRSIPMLERSRRAEMAERIASMTPKNAPPSDTVLMLREDRDR
jgi:hypothetical protein